MEFPHVLVKISQILVTSTGKLKNQIVGSPSLSHIDQTKVHGFGDMIIEKQLQTLVDLIHILSSTFVSIKYLIGHVLIVNPIGHVSIKNHYAQVSVQNSKGIHNLIKDLNVQVLTKDPRVHVYETNK